MRWRLGTRGSRLALAQADQVAAALRAVGVEIEIVSIRTSGDRLAQVALAEFGGKALFVKEIEDGLLDKRIDLAVHSLKDMPAVLPAGLVLGAFPAREDPRDTLITRGAGGLDGLAAGSVVATSSLRRRALLLGRRPDLVVAPIRGNVDTRLAKLDAGQMDAIHLALAGLKRLGLQERATQVLDPKTWLPSLGQGVIGIEIRETDTRARELTGLLNHQPTEFALTCERAFQAALDGSCRTPIAGLATIEGHTLSFHGEVLAPDGSDHAESRFTLDLGHDPRRTAQNGGARAGEALKPRVAKWLAL